MGVLDSRFSREDVDTLIEAMGDWEAVGNQEFYVLNAIKQVPMPPENHEAYEHIARIKRMWQDREREIEATRRVRQEKAVFTKAKLMLVRQDIEIGKLLEFGTTTENTSAVEQVKGPVEAVEAGEDAVAAPEAAPVSNMGDVAEKLRLAEYFIKDLGVWTHYTEFLAKNPAPPVEG